MADFPNSIALSEIRTALEKLVENLVTVLDTLDADPDLEDDGTAEPWLGAFEQQALEGGTNWYNSAVEDREVEYDEPSLGAPEASSWLDYAQIAWAQGDSSDVEESSEDEGSGDLAAHGSLDHLPCNPIRLRRSA